MEALHDEGVKLSYQSFAAGFRIEHPQGMLDTIQYGAKYAGYVRQRERTASRRRLPRRQHRPARNRRRSRVLQLLHVSGRTNRPHVDGERRIVHQRHEL